MPLSESNTSGPLYHEIPKRYEYIANRIRHFQRKRKEYERKILGDNPAAITTFDDFFTRKQQDIDDKETRALKKYLGEDWEYTTDFNWIKSRKKTKQESTKQETIKIMPTRLPGMTMRIIQQDQDRAKKQNAEESNRVLDGMLGILIYQYYDLVLAQNALLYFAKKGQENTLHRLISEIEDLCHELYDKIQEIDRLRAASLEIQVYSQPQFIPAVERARELARRRISN